MDDETLMGVYLNTCGVVNALIAELVERGYEPKISGGLDVITGNYGIHPDLASLGLEVE